MYGTCHHWHPHSILIPSHPILFQLWSILLCNTRRSILFQSSANTTGMLLTITFFPARMTQSLYSRRPAYSLPRSRWSCIMPLRWGQVWSSCSYEGWYFCALFWLLCVADYLIKNPWTTNMLNQCKLNSLGFLPTECSDREWEFFCGTWAFDVRERYSRD